MGDPRAPTALAVSGTLYRLLLRLCPAEYRHEYGAPMAQAFRDLAREAYDKHGSWGVMALWLRALPDACSTAVAERIVATKERRALANVQLAAVGAEGEYSMRSTLSTVARPALSAGALLAGAVSVWPLYILALLHIVSRLLGPGSPNGVLILPVAMWAFWVTTLFSHLGRYLAISAAGILLALAALRFGPRNRVLRAVEALTLVGILAFPCFFHYQPPLVAAPGGLAYVPTQPGLLDGVVKNAQVAAERVPSTYEIVGWSGDGVLYYQETVKATEATRTWAYTPGKGARPQLVAEAAGLAPRATAEREALLELVRAPTQPERSEPSSRPLKIRQDGLASPDGRWAAVVAKHIYGPEDVIVVAME